MFKSVSAAGEQQKLRTSYRDRSRYENYAVQDGNHVTSSDPNALQTRLQRTAYPVSRQRRDPSPASRVFHPREVFAHLPQRKQHNLREARPFAGLVGRPSTTPFHSD